MEARLFPYKRAGHQDDGFAVITCDAEAHRRLSAMKAIRIGWVRCRVDTHIHITRCPRCGLLGHSEARCTLMELPEKEAGVDTENQPCRDCAAHNHRTTTAAMASKIKMHPRLTNHRTGSKECPTLKAFLRKATPNPAPTAANDRP